MLLLMEQALDGKQRIWSYLASTLRIEVVSGVQHTCTILTHVCIQLFKIFKLLIISVRVSVVFGVYISAL
jgi:hypothetical protein